MNKPSAGKRARFPVHLKPIVAGGRVLARMDRNRARGLKNQLTWLLLSRYGNVHAFCLSFSFTGMYAIIDKLISEGPNSLF
jgi:hypothetical protein